MSNPKVNAYINKLVKWRVETEKLRAILLDTDLTEDLKWGKPCYTFRESNIAIIQGFKEFCALMFFKGALLKDDAGILQKVGENSQATRRMEFTDIRQITESEPFIKLYIKEIIEAEKAGLKVNFKKTDEFTIPEEFKNKTDEVPALEKAFKALTPGRQRAYLLYFSVPKKSETRISRIEKCIPLILNGKGLNDR